MAKETSKNIYEEHLCRFFLKIFNENFGTTYEFVRSGEQGRLNEPDCICSEDLCIEITRGFYSENLNREMNILKSGGEIKFPRTEATLIKISTGIHLPSSGLLVGPDIQACREVILLMNEKNGKKYDGIESKKLFLLIDVYGFSLTKLEDFEQYFQNFQWNHGTFTFSEVWIIDWNGIARIYPAIL